MKTIAAKQNQNPLADFATTSLAVLPSEHGSNVFIVDTEMLAGVSEELRPRKVGQIVRKRTGAKHVEITRVEPIYDSEGEIKAFMAFARP